MNYSEIKGHAIPEQFHKETALVRIGIVAKFSYVN